MHYDLQSSLARTLNYICIFCGFAICMIVGPRQYTTNQVLGSGHFTLALLPLLGLLSVVLVAAGIARWLLKDSLRIGDSEIQILRSLGGTPKLVQSWPKSRVCEVAEELGAQYLEQEGPRQKLKTIYSVVVLVEDGHLLEVSCADQATSQRLIASFEDVPGIVRKDLKSSRLVARRKDGAWTLVPRGVGDSIVAISVCLLLTIGFFGTVYFSLF